MLETISFLSRINLTLVTEILLQILDSKVMAQKDDQENLNSFTFEHVDEGSVLYCERFMEFLIDLLSQLPTRR